MNINKLLKIAQKFEEELSIGPNDGQLNEEIGLENSSQFNRETEEEAQSIDGFTDYIVLLIKSKMVIKPEELVVIREAVRAGMKRARDSWY